MVQNEANWLRLHLPHLIPTVDGLIIVDGGSTDDSVSVARELGASVYEHSFEQNYGKQAQYLLDCAEQEGYDAFLRLDPDETLFAHDVDAIRVTLNANPKQILQFPRINFVKDRLHYSTTLEPYDQFRAWGLGFGIRYHDVRVHETPTVPDGVIVTRVPQTIYHYGWIKPPKVKADTHRLYKKLGGANEPFSDTEYPPHEPYIGLHPINPYRIGITAPLGQ